jgi:acetyl esterase/lipase
MISEEMSRIIDLSITARERTKGAVVPLVDRRQQMQKVAARMPESAEVSVEVVDARGVPCEWIRPTVPRGSRSMLYFHGGGYANGSLETHRKMIGFIAAASGLAVLSVGYRLAPENPYPAAIDDGVTALSWLLSTGVSADQVVIAGDSSGGGLALATCLASMERLFARPGALVLLSPWVDMTFDLSQTPNADVDDPLVSRSNLDELRRFYLGGADPALPLVSPLRANLTGLPPTFIQVGQRELLRDDASRLYERLVDSGVDATCAVWLGMVHVWQYFAGAVPEADAALSAIASWLDDLPENQSIH